MREREKENEGQRNKRVGCGGAGADKIVQPRTVVGTTTTQLPYCICVDVRV